MKRKRTLWLFLTLVAVLAAAGIFYFSTAGNAGRAAQSAAATSPEIEQAVARTGSLTVAVSGSGELIPVSSTSLGFSESGVLVELNVKAGDLVQTGEVLARLQIDKTPAEWAAELASAELEVLRSGQALEELQAGAQLAAAQALADLEEAQQALQQVEDTALEVAQAGQGVSQAKAALQSAEMALYIANSSPSQEAQNIAYASLLFKQKDLQEFQQQIARVENQIKNASDKNARDRLKQQLLSMQAQLARQQAEYEDALFQDNTMQDPPEALELALAESQLNTANAQLANAQRELEKAQGGPNSSALAIAQANLAQAQDKWERLQAGPDPQELALAEARLATAQAKLALAQQATLVKELAAPSDATVLATSAATGDRLNGQAILTLADLSQPLLQVYLDETDLGSVRAGYQASVVFDALPDVTFTAQVVQVDPSLMNFGNTAALRAEVLLDPMSGTAFNLPVGADAAVDIIAGETSNAVLVPVEALHQQPGGGFVVYVVANGQLEARPVEVGLMDITTAEIVAGLQSGEAVAIAGVSTGQE